MEMTSRMPLFPGQQRAGTSHYAAWNGGGEVTRRGGGGRQEPVGGWLVSAAKLTRGLVMR